MQQSLGLRAILRVFVLILLPASLSHATTTTYVLEDLATFTSGAAILNKGETFSGPGFVCMAGEPGPETFWHLFAFGGTANFRTAVQVDISDLQGTLIEEAILSFKIKTEGLPEPQDVTFTSYTSDGTIAFTTVPPDNHGSVTIPITGPIAGQPTNVSLDVTGLLQERVNVGADWFALWVTGSNFSKVGTYATYTFTPGGQIVLLPDNAEVRLAVTFIPEPAGGLAGAVLLLWMARRRAQPPAPPAQRRTLTPVSSETYG